MRQHAPCSVVQAPLVPIEANPRGFRQIRDFFGELRALEWGAGYAYPRLASVLASSPLRLLVFPEGVLAQLVERYPALDRVIREAVAERLQRHS